jgi:hypothetical protein
MIAAPYPGSPVSRAIGKSLIILQLCLIGASGVSCGSDKKSKGEANAGAAGSGGVRQNPGSGGAAGMPGASGGASTSSGGQGAGSSSAGTGSGGQGSSAGAGSGGQGGSTTNASARVQFVLKEVL